MLAVIAAAGLTTSGEQCPAREEFDFKRMGLCDDLTLRLLQK